ncbi:competence damage-inducible protein A [Polynucleobacter sp. SHI8]|uniref:CinA family protein n=1 Tax=unclassified Polynucleobacter TaxID=2640945 RepID=UPI002490BFC8|nr:MULTISPECIES: CinA family protein [unclassified Polynucleobacter]BDW10153.1 competence damage-inducible protein A [Polynucleobacter sp. SHI2]BDW12599.1 competence damage-inducible protein A [Polynucleobacter sp. SHI8]
MNQVPLEQHVAKLAQLLLSNHLSICTAESCTGGMVAAALTDLSGSSSWFERGFVTYSNESKHQELGVSMDLIQTHGAVSVSVAEEMAKGAISSSGAQVSLAITGVAGPTGGSLEKPVGFVCFSWAIQNKDSLMVESEGVALLSPQDMINDQTRLHVRTLARDYAILGMITRLEKILK